jgi:hypothetical protein
MHSAVAADGLLSKSHRNGKPVVPKRGRQAKLAFTNEQALGDHAKFLKKKEELDKQCKEILAVHKGNACVVVRLERHKATIGSHQDLPMNMDTAIQELRDVDKLARAVHAKVTACKEGALAPVEAEIRDVLTRSTKALSVGASLIQSCEILVGSQQKEKRSVYLKKNHQNNKVASALKAGGFAKHIATHIGALVAPLLNLAEQGKTTTDGENTWLPPVINASAGVCFDADDDFDHNSIAIWSKPPAVMKAVYTACETSIVKQTTKAGDKMAAHFADWNGAQSKVEFEPKNYGGVQLDEGFGPFVVSIKKDAPRFGPSAFPLPIVGCYISPMSANMIVLLYNVKEILKQGITLNDIKSFLGTPSGSIFLKSENTRAVFLPVGSTLHVPWGWLPQPLYYNPAPKNEKVDSCLHFLHVPVISQSLAQSIDKQVLKAASTSIEAHLKTCTAQFWKERSEACTKFFLHVELSLVL